MFKMILFAGLAIGLGLLTACEKAGEKMDSAIEQATKGEKDLKDGPLEKAGEKADSALGIKNKDAADNLGDAVDGDPKTKPN